MLFQLAGKLIVGCQPSLVGTAERGEAAALYLHGPADVLDAKAVSALPVIAGWERPDERGVSVLTPDLKSAGSLAAAGADVIALEAGARAHPVPGRLAQLITGIREELGRPVLALVANAEEAVRAAAYGAGWVGVGLGQVRETVRALESAVPVVALLDREASAADARAALQDGAAAVLADVSRHVGTLAGAVCEEAGPPTAERYWAAAGAAIARVTATQGPAIREAAALCAKSLLNGGVVHIFGAGHSRAFGMELSGRAGGLVPMHVFGLEEVAPPGKKGLQLLDLERSPETAHALLATFPVHPADVFVIASNSGRNGCPVELALEVKRRGHALITVTSLAHTGAVTARHPSGQRVYEVADVVIDNGAPYGDAVLRVEGMEEAICAVSSATGALIAQALTAETIRLIREAGGEPPVYVSANVDGSDEHNARLEARYAGRI